MQARTWLAALCCALNFVPFLILAHALLLSRARPSEEGGSRGSLQQSPQSSPKSFPGASCDGASEDGSCSIAGPRAQWWILNDHNFTIEHVLHINTFNFNSTATGATEQPLLIAFYDPRSQSFKDLKTELEEAARALASHEAAGAPIGKIGACDVTVNTFLGQLQAPEMFEGWQSKQDGRFRFSKPRYFPLIVVVYEGGERLGEYTGVVNQKHMAAFLQRRSARRGGADLVDSAAVHALFRGPGPVAVGCDLEQGTETRQVFSTAAHELHGMLVFGRASRAICEEVLGGAPADTWPQVLWGPGGASSPVRRLTEAATVKNATKLVEWLTGQRPSLLKEMTPDTSHKYLDRPEPLLIFLVDPGDKQGWERGMSMFASIEDRLVGSLQLVWSDCVTFGSQFAAEGKCPVIVVVKTVTMDWRKITLQKLEEPRLGGGHAPDASQRLLLWLKNVTRLSLRRKDHTNTSKSYAASLQELTIRPPMEPAPSPAELAAQEKKQSISEESMSDEAFMEALPELPNNLTSEAVPAFAFYSEALNHLLQLQVSYEVRYGRNLPFDFSDLQRAQRLHRSMRSLATSPASVKSQVQNSERLRALWQEVEWQADFRLNLSRNVFLPGEKAKFAKLLTEGYNLVRGVFLRLFHHLHHHAAAGTIGTSPATQQEVERRAASELSVTEFLERYARRGHPVIITGLNITEGEPWTLDFFKRRCNVTAAYLRKNVRNKAWANLEEAGVLPLAEFLDTFTSNATRRQWYLHDWALPRRCPDVFGPAPYRSFTVPKYFAGDYFQRAAFDGYQHSWPSLFVGSNETQSALHIDSGGTNFWLFLLSGRKEWRFFSRRDLVNVYQSPLFQHFLPDIFSPDFEKFPLLKYAEMFVGVQEPGELVFIPGGNPHAVQNLEHIHGLSMNYADLSNIWIYLWHMLAAEQWRSFEMFTDGISFPHGLQSSQQQLTFGEWKSTKWKDLTYDLQ